MKEAAISDSVIDYIRSLPNQDTKAYATRLAIWLARDVDSTVSAPKPFHLTEAAASAVYDKLRDLGQ